MRPSLCQWLNAHTSQWHACRVHWASLEPHVGALLQLPLRLMLSAPTASPMMVAAQRYSDGVLAVLAARAAHAAVDGAGAGAEAHQVGVGEAMAASYAAAAVVALADAAGRLLHRPTGSGGDAEAVAAVGDAPGRQQPLARLAVVAGATVSGAAALPAEDREDASAVVASAVSPADARECALGLLVSALGEQVSPAASLAVMEVARAAVQEAAGEEPGSARGAWARLVVGSLAPAAVARTAALLSGARQPLAGAGSGRGQPHAPLVVHLLRTLHTDAHVRFCAELYEARIRIASTLATLQASLSFAHPNLALVFPTGPEQSLVSECLKLLVLATTLSVPHGPAAQAGVMQVRQICAGTTCCAAAS